MRTSAVQEFQVGQLAVQVHPDRDSQAAAASAEAVEVLRRALATRGTANVLLATGDAQSDIFRHLARAVDVDWARVNFFHLDEYVGLAPDHPAAFAGSLRRMFLDPIGSVSFYPVPGRADDAELACRAYELLLRAYPIDLCLLGIGENGHIAFNEPGAARFDDPSWVKIVELEVASRRQQVGEGHFERLEDVPTQAISLTVPAIRAARRILCIAPDARKADAVRMALTGPVSTDCPASILRETPWATLYLDEASASALPEAGTW
jgi:glucosamine-6-phosphate deaminase